MTTNCSSSWIAEGRTNSIQGLSLKLVTGGIKPKIYLYPTWGGSTQAYTFSGIGDRCKMSNPEDSSEYFIVEFLNFTNLNA